MPSFLCLSHFLPWDVNTGSELTPQPPGHAHLGTTAIWHSSFRKMTGKGWSVWCVTVKKLSVGHADGLYKLWEWALPANTCPCLHVVHAPLRDGILAGFTEMPHKLFQRQPAASRHRLLSSGQLRWCWGSLTSAEWHKSRGSCHSRLLSFRLTAERVTRHFQSLYWPQNKKLKYDFFLLLWDSFQQFLVEIGFI